MFTGLIVELGTVLSLKRRGNSALLTLKSREISCNAKEGDSISVNGVCLTVINKNDNCLSFELSEETLISTNLASLKAGDFVNLEPSLSPTSKIGGHFVTGHVDGVGKIRSKLPLGNMWKIGFDSPPHIMGLIVKKGSVAIDGISLTVVDILKKGFTVIIIPHTARVTTMGIKGVGDTVNIEADILGKYVARILNIENNQNIRFKQILSEKEFFK